MLDEKKNPIFLLSKSDIGAGQPGAAEGPEAVKDEIKMLGIAVNDFEVVDSNSYRSNGIAHAFGKHIEDVIHISNLLNDKVEQVIGRERFPVILTGDHSNAIGGLSGLKNANPDKCIGVIWIDAHADLHSPYTTPSGNIHGMPIAALAGLDHLEIKKNNVDEKVLNYWDQLKKIGLHHLSPKFNIKDLVLIGVRDAEDEEWEVLEKSGVLNFDPDDIRQKGIEKVLSETMQLLDHCDLIYVSFDADSLDPDISTGTGTTAPDGLNMDEAKIIFRTLMAHPKLGAFEITEVNPSLDTGGKAMAKIIGELIHHGLTQ